jgi:hypothetical protein
MFAKPTRRTISSIALSISVGLVFPGVPRPTITQVDVAVGFCEASLLISCSAFWMFAMASTSRVSPRSAQQPYAPHVYAPRAFPDAPVLYSYSAPPRPRFDIHGKHPFHITYH